MARSEARLAVSIWNDADFLALSPTAQRLFMFLISQIDLAHDGVIALRVRRWSKSSAGLTVESIEADLAELSAARFVVIDEDAEELLVRSLIRRDKVYRQQNVMLAAADHLATVASPIIHAAVAAELARIAPGDIPEGAQKAFEQISEVARKGAVSAGDKGSGNPSGNPSAGAPGERGVVTAVSSDSPNPGAKIAPVPVPRDAAPPRPRENARKRATRIPDDFAKTGVTPEMVTWARENTPDVSGGYETAKFVDYWRAKSGKDATKLDWPGTWRNWMRKAQERAGPIRVRPTTDDKVHGFAERGRRLQALADQSALPDLKELGA